MPNAPTIPSLVTPIALLTTPPTLQPNPLWIQYVTSDYIEMISINLKSLDVERLGRLEGSSLGYVCSEEGRVEGRDLDYVVRRGG